MAKFHISRLTIYIDNWCPNCIKFGKLVTKMDTLKLISISNAREIENPHIETQKALSVMAAVTEDNSVSYGFDSIYQIAKRLPLLWLFYPIFWVLKISRTGHLIYRELAIKRKIIPIHCNEDCIAHKTPSK